MQQVLLQLAGLGLLLCPVVCAGGLAPCCAADEAIEETACCGCHVPCEDEPGPLPVDDGEDRECIASRANVETVSRSASNLVREIARFPSGPGAARTIAVPRPATGRRAVDARSLVPAIAVRTLNCALLL